MVGMLSKHLRLRDLPTASADLLRWQKLEAVQSPVRSCVLVWKHPAILTFRYMSIFTKTGSILTAFQCFSLSSWFSLLIPQDIIALIINLILERKKEGRVRRKKERGRNKGSQWTPPTHTRVLIHTFRLFSQSGSPAENSTPGKRSTFRLRGGGNMDIQSKATSIKTNYMDRSHRFRFISEAAGPRCKSTTPTTCVEMTIRPAPVRGSRTPSPEGAELSLALHPHLGKVTVNTVSLEVSRITQKQSSRLVCKELS